MNKKQIATASVLLIVALLTATGWIGYYSGPMTAGFYVGPESASCGVEYKGLPGLWCNG